MKFITNIWLRAVPMLRLWILLAFSTLAPLPMLGYDGHNQANIAYDNSRESAIGYDAGFTLATSEKRSGATEDRILFANFGEFLAAESGATRLLTAGTDVPNAGGVIRSFAQQGDQTYYRVFSGSQQGRFLTAVPPSSSAFAREALALPPGNQATFIQEVLVPNGTGVTTVTCAPCLWCSRWRRAI